MICVEIIGYDEKRRDVLIKKLKDNGIDSRPYFYPISDMPMYRKSDTEVTHKVYQRGLNLPSYFELNKDDIKYIIKKFKELI
jgi:perosamine synthetase